MEKANVTVQDVTYSDIPIIDPIRKLQKLFPSIYNKDGIIYGNREGVHRVFQDT